MKATKVVEAAQLIDQLDKLNGFLTSAPEDSDTLTITFRRGNRSKSLSLKNQETIINIREIVEDIRDDTRNAILELGIEV